MRPSELIAVTLGLVTSGVTAANAVIGIYPDSNFGGTGQQFTTVADGRCWPVTARLNNQISSFRVVLDPGVFCFFYDGSDCNASNELFSVLTNWNNPSLGGADNKISSFKCQ
ncbi:hypothetical protein HJFPF1_13003 [Paramyrothecium foliicola]|nr:hypothetical protein HJFPF1_13003 [Paramyrothecium foliicola]